MNISGLNWNLKKINLSIIIPLFNESENIKPMFSRLKEVLPENTKNIEIIFVNDGSTDQSEEILRNLYLRENCISVINMAKRFGKAAALEMGFRLAKGDLIVTLDSDLENDPVEIPKLVNKISEGYDLVSGRRMERKDSWGKLITSKMFNFLIRLSTGLRLYDYFSGLKCYRREVLRMLNLHGDLYRYAAVFAYYDGFKVTEIPVTHNPRKFGKSKYSRRSRFARGFGDLLIILFTIKFNQRRIYLIGAFGIICLGLGITVIFLASIVYFLKIFLIKNLFLITGLALMYLGAQMMLFKRLAWDFTDRHISGVQVRKRHIKSILDRENRTIT